MARNTQERKSVEKCVKTCKLARMKSCRRILRRLCTALLRLLKSIDIFRSSVTELLAWQKDLAQLHFVSASLRSVKHQKDPRPQMRALQADYALKNGSLAVACKSFVFVWVWAHVWVGECAHVHMNTCFTKGGIPIQTHHTHTYVRTLLIVVVFTVLTAVVISTSFRRCTLFRLMTSAWV